jgi:ribosomal-protein-alanine N-acetyltransferase
MAALHAAAFPDARPWSAEEIAALLASPGCFAVDDPAGFALGRAVLDEAELLTIAVAPEARRRGAGRRLLAAFERQAAAMGARTAHLEVAAGNIAARALYAGAGFAETGRRRGYYRHAGVSDDAVLLTRRLDAGRPA